MSTGTPISKEGAITQLRAFYDLHGRPPSCRELKSPTVSHVPHSRTLTRLFGSEKEAIKAAGLPPRLRNTTPPVRPPRDPHLTPLEHQWYEAQRVINFIMAHNLGQPVYSLLAWQNEAAARRWQAFAHGGQPYVRLDVVDKILTLLDLHIWNLGDPDLVCGHAPRPGVDYQLSLEQEAA